jgi:peptidoglycan hydrolase-like protein with peptidoglycan-binding domain
MNAFGYGFVGTGCYGDKTSQAVRDLQAANNITTSGLLGPKTWQAAWTGTAPKQR